MGRCWREYLLPFYVGNGFGAHFKRRPTEPDSVLDVDYLIEHDWFVGSPATVIEKLQRLQQDTGGFGGLLVMIYDATGEQSWWDESLDLLAHAVMPHFAD
jgi:alkanesulfonate monooxygenase SsuD/methylene tetrahydromethanopterin reductase-like flavin-dependent oxidoreductase (luciferase family)